MCVANRGNTSLSKSKTSRTKNVENQELVFYSQNENQLNEPHAHIYM